jgi:glycine betaine/proline transport system substrate-binding protein
MGKYEMVALDAGVPNDKEMWDACTSQADCADPKPNAYPVSDVFTVVTKGFAEKAGVAMEYVKTRKWDNQTVGQLLAWKDENQGSNEDTAYYFLTNNKEMWTKWLPEDVAAKVEAEL